MAMTLVETVTVGSGGAASIDFTNIPQTGKDLLVFYSARRDSASELATFMANGLGGGSGAYDYRTLLGSGTAASSQSRTSDGGVDVPAVSSAFTVSTFGNTQIYISNYTNTTTNKAFSVDGVNENNAAAATTRVVAGVIKTTNAITSIKLDGAFVQHSTASLYIIS